MAETVLIVGATAGIARPLCRRLAARGCRQILAGRDDEALAALADELRREFGTAAAIERFDALELDSHAGFFARCIAVSGDRLDGLIVCHGYLPSQAAAERDAAEALRTIQVNFSSVVSLLTPAANWFEARGGGYLAVISSVAGDRGRQCNYVYGSTKAGLSAFLEGLRARLHRSGVAVITIKPGYVATRMTAGRVDPRSWLVATPERVARDIDRAIRRRRDVIYTPWFWRPILAAARMVPECVFKRLRF